MSEQALREAYQRYFPVIWGRCRRLLGDGEEARDVAQETFLKLWQQHGAKAPPRSAAAWIHRTSVNLALDRLRARPHEVELSDSLEASFPEVTSVLGSRRALATLARRVSSEVLEIGVLHRVDGLTQPEIAAVMGCSERSIRRRLTELDEHLARMREELTS